MIVGQQISIMTSYATAHCCLATVHFHAVIVGETEKAVKIKAITESGDMTSKTCWLPRKAIVTKTHRDTELHELARWFKPTGFTEYFFRRYSCTHMISA